MSGEQPNSFPGAPALAGGDGAESVSGGTNGSAPVSPGLAERHHYAMQIVGSLDEAERWALLEAVVWPSDVLAELTREAA